LQDWNLFAACVQHSLPTIDLRRAVESTKRRSLSHLVNIQFKRKTIIRDICIYTIEILDIQISVLKHTWAHNLLIFGLFPCEIIYSLIEIILEFINLKLHIREPILTYESTEQRKLKVHFYTTFVIYTN